MKKFIAFLLIFPLIGVQPSNPKECPSNDGIQNFKNRMEQEAKKEGIELRFFIESINDRDLLESVAREERVIFISCLSSPQPKKGTLALNWKEIPKGLLSAIDKWHGRAFKLESIKI